MHAIHSDPKRRTLDEVHCAQALQEVGLVPVFIALDTPKRDRDQMHRSVSGLFIPGGGDVNPNRYRQSLHPKTSGINDLLDEIQAESIEEAISEDKPILGTCRGAQLLVVASGGDLYQHLPEAFPEEIHGVSIEEKDASKKIAYHDILIEPGTKAYEIFQTELLKDVNSLHHQGIRNPGNRMKISGLSPMGVVEFIEAEGVFCFGAQCHPNMDKKLMPIFDHFATAIYQRGRKKEK